MSPNLYNDYAALKKAHGASAARQIILFRLSHIQALISAAKEDGPLLLDSQARKLEQMDVFFDSSLFSEAKQELKVYMDEMYGEDEEKKYGAFHIIEEQEELAVRSILDNRVYAAHILSFANSSEVPSQRIR